MRAFLSRSFLARIIDFQEMTWNIFHCYIYKILYAKITSRGIGLIFFSGSLTSLEKTSIRNDRNARLENEDFFKNIQPNFDFPLYSNRVKAFDTILYCIRNFAVSLKSNGMDFLEFFFFS